MHKHMDCGLPHPVFRANPCPEDTNLLCRLPLPAVFYKPGAANLGDLMCRYTGAMMKLGIRKKQY